MVEHLCVRLSSLRVTIAPISTKIILLERLIVQRTTNLKRNISYNEENDAYCFQFEGENDVKLDEFIFDILKRRSNFVLHVISKCLEII